MVRLNSFVKVSTLGLSMAAARSVCRIESNGQVLENKEFS